MQYFEYLAESFGTPTRSFLRPLLKIIVIILILRVFVYGLYQVPSSSMETTMLIGERFLADKFSYYLKPVQRGDIIIFNDPNFKYSPYRIIRFFQRYFWGPANWTKRVIGIPGDHIKGKIEHGRPIIYRNEIPLCEPYVNEYYLLGVCGENSSSIRFKSYNKNLAFESQSFYTFDQAAVEKAKMIAGQKADPVFKAPHSISYCQNGRNVDIFEKHLKDNEYWVMGDNRLASFDSRFWGIDSDILSGDYIHGRIFFRLLSVDSDNNWLFCDFLEHPFGFFKKIRWSRCFQFIY